jgi:hypothetical protein
VSSTSISRYSDTRYASQPPYCTVECDDGRKARIRKTVSVSRFWFTSDFDNLNWHTLHQRLRQSSYATNFLSVFSGANDSKQITALRPG